MIRGIAKAGLGSLPFVWRWLRSAKLMMKRGERELYLLPFLVDPKRRAVDIGGNTGIYTQALLALGASVCTIEANPNCVRVLKRLYGNEIRLFPVAVSDAPGKAKLRFPAGTRQSGLSTLEASNDLRGAETSEMEVDVTRVDDLDLGDVGFVKIDVEGHELAVLLGAQETIARCLPVFLIESEERHRPGAVASVRELLEGFGYEGFAIWMGLLRPLASLDIAALQAVDAELGRELDKGHVPEDYVNNFIFLPTRKVGSGAGVAH